MKKERKQHIYKTCLKPRELELEFKKTKIGKQEQQKIYAEFVAEQVEQNRVYTIRYIQDFLNVSRDWIVRNIIPNVPHWKFYDRYIYPYHKHLDPDLKGKSSAKMHDLIDIFHLKNDNGKLLFSLHEILLFIQKNVTYTRQTIFINLFDLMNHNQIKTICDSDTTIEKTEEMINDVIVENELKIVDSKFRSEVEHINVTHLNIANMEHDFLKNRLATAKQINAISELAYRNIFANGLIKITFKSDNKTWFFTDENYFKNSKEQFKFLIAYSDYLRIKDSLNI